MLFENDCLITDTKQVADVFDRYFTEIAQGIGFNDPYQMIIIRNLQWLPWSPDMILIQAW